MSNELDMNKKPENRESESNVSDQTLNRRRLLRAGVKVVPVVLGTLSARTSLACHCTIPSAWGSIATGLGGPQDMSQVNLTGSLVRFKSADSDALDNVRTFSNDYRNIPKWQYGGEFPIGTTSGDAWVRWKLLSDLVTQYPSGCSTSVKKVNYIRGLWAPNNGPKLSANGLLAKLGLGSVSRWSLSAQSIVSANNGDSSILVGLFCQKLGGTFVSTGCLRSSDLVAMANGTFPVPQGFTTFGSSEIKDYLHYNWIARWDYS